MIEVIPVDAYLEFFNDVFGPMMQPGSSSHTAGPCFLLPGALPAGRGTGPHAGGP